jgi:hypothetical protein
LSLLNTYEDRFGSNEVIYLRVDGGSVVPQLTNISVFSGTNRIATFDGAPRLLALTNLPPGPYNLIAVARSSFEGKQGTSCPLSFVVFPAPRNDSFYRATHIDGTSYVTNATNVGASAEPTEPVASSLYYATPRRSVWWCWTAPVSGSFAVEVTSEEISPQVGVFTGSNLSQLERVAATGPGSNVVTAFNATAGTHYFISVDSAYSGDFLFRLRPATPPSNDDHTNRIALTGADFAINANNVDATREPAPFFDSADSPASVWWRWTAPIGGKYILSVSSATFSPVLDVRSVSNGFSLPDYPRPRVVVSASAGQEFDLRVAGSSGGMGPFTLSISNLSAPLNDRFSDALPLSGLPVMVNGTTLGATTEPYEPGSTVASVWYRWIAPSNCVVAVETEPRYFVVLGVYSGTSLSNLVALGDEFAPAVVFAATAGREYYFSVDDYYGDLSDFTLTVRTAQSPANDDFANAVVLTGSPVSVIGSNREATLEAGEPSYYDDSVWYRWVAPSYGPYTVSIEGGFAQLLVTPYTGSSLTNLVRATMTSRAPEQNFTGRIDAIAGFEYFLAVSSYAGAGGPFRLRMQPATPPPNDNFADRIELSGITLQITNALAHSSVESGESLSDSFAGGSVWWSWTAPESRKMVVWLSEMFNYNVQVFTGTSLTALANVAEYPSTWNQIIFDAQAGQRYAIQVSSRTQGASTLNMAPLAQPPNDHFTNAFVLTGISASATGVGLGATREAGEPAHPYRDEGTLWWNWTAPTSGRVAISFDSGLSQIPVVVYGGESVGSLTNVTDSNLSYGRTTFLARAGETYRIAVYAQAVRPFQIFLTAPAPPPSPQLESMRRLANGTFEFQFDAIMGQTNVIDASTDLINWVPVATNFLDCGLLNVLDPTAAGFPHRFYRLRKP